MGSTVATGWEVSLGGKILFGGKRFAGGAQITTEQKIVECEFANSFGESKLNQMNLK